MIQTEDYVSLHKRKKRRRLLVTMLSLAVAVSTVLALMIPALTMENEPESGAEEHLHSDSCYEVHKICAYGEETDTVGNSILICGLEEGEDGHQHTEECFHTHTEECFEKTLICTISEQQEKDAESETAETNGIAESTDNAENAQTAENAETADSENSSPDAQNEAAEKSVSDDETKNPETEIESAEPEINGETEENKETIEAESIEVTGEPAEAESTEPEMNPDMQNTEESESELTPSENAAAAPRKAMLYAANSAVIRKLTVAKVRTEGETLKKDDYTFYLYDGNTLIDEATNDADGNITFSVPIDGAGIYQYTVKQKIGNRTNVTYDTNSYTITIAVEDDNVVSENFRSDVYYGLTDQSTYTSTNMTYRFYMSPTLGKRDYRVFCIDHSANQAPRTATNQIYWVAEVNPSEEMILSCVCNSNGYSSGSYYSAYDGWCDDLTVNLKKLLYSITYGDNSGMTDLAKQTLTWQMTQGYDSVSGSNGSIITNILKNTTVPSGYQLVLFHPSDSTYQSFVALLPATQVQNIKMDSVEFVNRITSGAESVTAVFEAMKQLDGEEPGKENIFKFQLTDAAGNILQTKANDAAGQVCFDQMVYQKAGTYTYTIREVNDGRSNIKYDTGLHTVTVTTDEKDYYDLTGDAYYSVQGKDYGYYVSRNSGNTDFPVYGTDWNAKSPSTTGSTAAYTVLKNPDSETLEDYVTVNRYGSELADNLRKLLYYFETHDLSNTEKINYMIAATTRYYNDYDTELSRIFAQSIPEDYRLVLFVPKGYARGLTSVQQPLLGAMGPKITYTDGSSPVFKNKTESPSGYVLPSTGGAGTFPVTFIGLLLIIGAAMMYIYENKRRIGGSEQTGNR